uniref:Ubiquinone biosynthesis monooxygenase COQ6, mitochondrial n=1 Tax=Albugo laibachii Nc14 TaxID=890382 RepID=F0WQF7_9STRA|nr:ubiquinone biosynthesis monooxygenase putative [Albugo laibachii Nc14]|eukprot:CCA23565.1 ubiquinone biosynthesis monooxygenase putative [Albugo laibachii Nc14]
MIGQVSMIYRRHAINITNLAWRRCMRVNPICSQLIKTFANSSESHYDIAIVGGGVVGKTVACQLLTNPVFKSKKIALIATEIPSSDTEEVSNAQYKGASHQHKHNKSAPDLRVYTITPQSRNLLKACGVWDKLLPNDFFSFQDMQVWDAVGNGHIRFNAQQAGKKYLAHVVEHKVLLNALQKRMEELQQDFASFSTYVPAKVKHYRPPDAGSYASHIGLENGDEIRATLIIAADGGKSVIRTLSNLGTWGWDYDQVALVTTVRTDQPNYTAWQRFFPTGPLALLPMRDGHSSVVWSCSAEMATDLTRLTRREFCEQLNEALLDPPKSAETFTYPGFPLFSDLVKGVTNTTQTIMAVGAMADRFQAPPKVTDITGDRVHFPLKMSHAITYCRPGVALVGDSAHAIHPLAGQGLNLGLADAEALVNVLSEGVACGESLSSPLFLQEYERKRKQANVMMALVMDGFKRLFGPSPDVVALARNVGMTSLNAVEPLKNQVIKYAMGLT